MIKKSIYTYRGVNQDTSRSKHSPELYFEGQHIRILATDSQSTGNVTNEKGNEIVLTIPNININQSNRTINYNGNSLPYKASSEIDRQINNNILSPSSNSQVIIGHTNTREGVVLFTTDENMDCVWLIEDILDDSYNLKLLYVRNLEFSKNNPIQAIFNYENEIIQKVYWVDGVNQLRFININHSVENGDLEELIDLDSTSINVSGQYSLSQPEIPQITQGGTHTAGMIQYAYNLYKLNGSQTTISPLSELVPLDFGNTGGGDINEIVGASPLIEIDNLDSRYTNIKVYAIKYTSYNETPSISLIVDEEIANYTKFSHFDNGSIINTVSLSEFLFLGSNVFIPRHIETKDNRMFAASLQDNNFDFEFDSRAYGHNNVGIVQVWDNVSVNASNVPIGTYTYVDTSTYNLPTKHDAINLNYDLFKFQKNGTTIGGEGKFIKYEIRQKTLNALSNKDLKYNQFFKDLEIYRIGIQLYNRLGQTSQPFWIADFKAPKGNLEGTYNTLNVTIKQVEFQNYINSLNLTEDQIPVGYKIIRADRTINDKTIICQGGLSTMMAQTTRDVKNFNFWKQEANRKDESNSVVKLPIIFQRGRNNYEGVVSPMKHLFHMNENASVGGDDDQEIFREGDTDYKRQQTWQYTRMAQMHSPDILFQSGVSLTPSLQLRVLGVCPKEQTNIWHYRVNVATLNKDSEDREADYTNFQRGDGIIEMYGLFGPSRDDTDDKTIYMSFKQYYHDYGNIVPAPLTPKYNIYGTPEITERGQGPTDYNNDPKYKYANTLVNFLTDRKKWTGGPPSKDEDAITGINTFGAKCATFVLGDGEITNATKIEDVWNTANITSSIDNDKGILIGEFTYPSYYAYVGNIYGGNTYEDKSRSSYIEIGEYQDMNDTNVQIDSPGDTFVQTYKVARLSKTDTEVIAPDKMQLTEILEFPVETTVNLINRSDTSLQSWDSELQPRYEEYHNYNRVYSQQPTLIQNKAESFKFKKSNLFDTRIISSKLKVPGETIDSWTDFLENEVMDLDGKYGPINSLTSFKDNIFAFQDKAISSISINPRVQVQGSDGIDIELGTGSILYDYNYLTTKSGSINKWGIVSTKRGIYYYDALNKSIGRVPDLTSQFLTDLKGLHTFYNNNYSYKDLKVDNPLIKQGVNFGYDNYNNDVYFTLHQGDKSFTWCYNELIDQFIDIKTYRPGNYINLGEKLIITDPTESKLYEQYKGEYNIFFDQKQSSYITLLVNPETNNDCTFTNINYRSEMYLNGQDLPKETLTHIQAYNEYQDTGRVALNVGRNLNLRRKFRDWKADIPREGRNRIRNPWTFIKLELDNDNNYKMILHDTIVYYSTY